MARLKRLEAAVFDDRSRQLDHFGRLLLVTIAAIVTLFLFDLRSPAGDLSGDATVVVVTVFVGAMLLLALRASGVSRRWTRIADIGVLIGLVASVVLLLLGLAGVRDQAGGYSMGPSFLMFALAGVAPIMVIRRLSHHRRVSLQTVLGAVAAYLLIAVAFDFLFLAADFYQGTPFFGKPQPTTSFMYFSLVSVTTTGYGDLVATTQVGRLLATSEAVVGQVYLVTFVGMVVGLFAQSWRQGERPGE